jgi:hypothetical protein
MASIPPKLRNNCHKIKNMPKQIWFVFSFKIANHFQKFHNAILPKNGEIAIYKTFDLKGNS